MKRCCLIKHGKRRFFFARCRSANGWRRGLLRFLRVFSFLSFLSLCFSPRCGEKRHLLRSVGVFDATAKDFLSICCSPPPRKTVSSLSVSFLSSAKGEISPDRWLCWTIRPRLRRWLSSRKGNDDLSFCLFPLLGGIVASSLSGESKVDLLI